VSVDRARLCDYHRSANKSTDPDPKSTEPGPINRPRYQVNRPRPQHNRPRPKSTDPRPQDVTSQTRETSVQSEKHTYARKRLMPAQFAYTYVVDAGAPTQTMQCKQRYKHTYIHTYIYIYTRGGQRRRANSTSPMAFSVCPRLPLVPVGPLTLGPCRSPLVLLARSASARQLGIFATRLHTATHIHKYAEKRLDRTDTLTYGP
jgi:hypothetical protein